MENNEETFDSPSNRQPQSELDDDQAWAQLTSRYLRDLPHQLDGIRTVLEVKDYSAIKKQAHRIKGTAGTYRLDAISKSAAQLERLADTQNSDAIAAAINKVKRLVELETNRLNSQTVPSSDNSERNTNG